MKSHCTPIAVSVLVLASLMIHAQEISVYPTKRDPLQYTLIEESSRPEPMSCETNGVRNYSIKYTASEIVAFGYRIDTIKTDKEEWNDEDDRELEETYNKEHQAELEELLKTYDEERGDLSQLSKEYLQDLIEKRWFTEAYSFCKIDCKSAIQECRYYWEIRWLGEPKVEYRFKVSSSWHEEMDNGPHEVEITWDLYIDYEAMIYFQISCFCMDIPDLMSADPVTPGEISPPWDNIDFTAAGFKTGAPINPPDVKTFPWLPVIGGVVGTGVITYLVVDGDDDPADCTFTATTQITGSTCGQANGSASVSVTPSGDYTYAWSNGSTSSSISNVQSGSFTVTVTRTGTTCNRVVSVTISNTDFPFAADLSLVSANCGSHNGSASISVSPAGQYAYAWSNGGSGSSQSNLAAGAYMVTVTLGTCSETYNLTVGELPPQFDINIHPIPASCGMSDGSAVAVVTKGDYSFLWSNGQTGAVLTDVPAGEYAVTVTINGTSCQKSSSVVVGERPADFTASFTTTPAGCGLNDGSALVTIQPDGNYDYVWSGGGSTTNQLSNIGAGEYQVTVTLNGTSCSQTFNVTVDELPAAFVPTASTTPANCKASDGSAVIAVDPPGEYDFAWSNGSAGPEQQNLMSGNYQVSVSVPGSACTVVLDFVIDELPPGFTASVTSTAAGCGASDGTATVTTDPPGNYTYLWTNGATESTAEGLAAGEHKVLVTDETGCCVEYTVVVDQVPADYITDVSSVPGNCVGEGSDIIVTTQTTGAGPMEITATGPDGVHVVVAPPGTVSLNTSFTILPGAWHLSVSDMSISASCTDEADVQVDDNTALTVQDDVYNTPVDQPISGNVLDNDSGLSLTVGDHTEPTGGILVLNNDGSFTFTPPVGATGQFSFQYQATDMCGNTAIGNVTIVVNPADCVFDATFNVINSNCGFENGSVSTTMIPPGEYTYQWSNGASSQNLVTVGDGIYSVTITSVSLLCNKEFVVQVNETPNTYIEELNPIPGNCTGEGDILIVLSSPGAGPLVLIIDGPEGTNQFTLPTGGHNLSASMNIPSGMYSITVYDEAAGAQCSQSVEVTVPDNTPVLDAMDDAYQTPFNTPVDGNVLDNDSGLDLTLTEVTQIIGGVVDFNADGSFTFIPDPSFSGVGGFTYTVTDACGTTATAFVEITVEPGVCDFTAEFTSTNSACGLETGAVSVVVDPPGTYLYEWSNGESGETITNVGAGSYSVTIEDVNLGCSLTFETQVSEDPAEYISDVEVIQPMCPITGDIRFTVSSPANGPFDITVSHPNGIDVFTVPEGQVILSDFISITDGMYNITVVDVNAGPACSDEFDATISGTTTLEIMVEAIIPASEPTAMDGAILVSVTMPTVPPYTIWLNGDAWGVTIEPFAAIEGLAPGMYQVQLQDNNGCFSNILEVVVPFGGTLNMEVGFGLGIMQSHHIVTPERPAVTESAVASFIDFGIHYRIAGLEHMNRLVIYGDGFNSAHYRVSQMVELWDHKDRGVHFKAHGGVSVDINRDIPTAQFWMIQGSASKRIGKVLTAHATITLRGWEAIDLPMVEAGLRIPMVRW